MKKFLAILMAAMMAIACTAAFAEDAGFEEFPIGEGDFGYEYTDPESGESKPILHVAGVYFQPVPMEPAGNALSVEESNFHIEADISYNKNALGFGEGDWAPYLTVNYTITSQTTNEVAAEGTFMVMSASDGPHYGANVKLDKADTYTVTFSIEPATVNGYLLHVDEETGVTGRFWEEPIVVTFTDWEYTVQEW